MGELKSALLWLLWHHQGGSSWIGQPIRKMLGIGEYDDLTEAQLSLAKSYAAHQPSGVAEGFQLIPKVISAEWVTKYMEIMRLDNIDNARKHIRALLAAAPTPPVIGE